MIGWYGGFGFRFAEAIIRLASPSLSDVRAAPEGPERPGIALPTSLGRRISKYSAKLNHPAVSKSLELRG